MKTTGFLVRYFQGFSDVSNYPKNKNKIDVVIGLLKIASYLTVFAPICIGIACLYGRMTQKSTISDINKRIDHIRDKTFNDLQSCDKSFSSIILDEYDNRDSMSISDDISDAEYSDIQDIEIDHAQILVIARTIIDQSEEMLPDYMRSGAIAEIRDERTLIEIAKSVAKEKGVRLSEYISYFNIKDQRALVEIAKIATENDGANIARYIKNYGIEKEKDLIEIAKLACQLDPENISYEIQKFGIKDQEALAEIAKFAAQKYGVKVICYIENYAIKNKTALIEIAKIAAQEDGQKVSHYIGDYIKENQLGECQQDLIEIAKLAACQNSATSEYIRNYGIRDEKALIEIAQIVAQADDDFISQNIQNYKIQDQKVLIEIAKLAAFKNGEEISNHIQNYRIQDRRP